MKKKIFQENYEFIACKYFFKKWRHKVCNYYYVKKIQIWSFSISDFLLLRSNRRTYGQKHVETIQMICASFQIRENKKKRNFIFGSILQSASDGMLFFWLWLFAVTNKEFVYPNIKRLNLRKKNKAFLIL